MAKKARVTKAAAKKVTSSRKPAARKRATSGKSAGDGAASPRTPGAGTIRQGHVAVRMYNNILGDCFLLRFPAESGEINMLIDCGALQGMPNAAEIMREIAADIKATTKGHLDIVVATHEHVDHLSGFAQAKDIFDEMTIGELWLAWTEDPSDPDATRLRTRRHKTLDLLMRLDKHYSQTPIAEEDEDPEDAGESMQPERTPDNVNQLFAFTGETGMGVAGQKRMTTGDILSYLKKKADKVRYFVPGSAPLPLPKQVPIQVYALGPPKDDKLLRRSNPRKGEVYLRGETDELAAYLAAAIGLDKEPEQFDADERKQFALAMPFDSQHIRSLSQMKAAGNDPYFDQATEWRQIDRDWLRASEQLALKLDSDTNNTSLVLAFVSGDGDNRRVMLFPGDAQVGNWESWQSYVWPKGAKHGDPSSVDIHQLFASTVLYKVGHHASHNATLREAGLELMTHPELTAMIPVNEAFARGTKKWNMPFPALLARLMEKTQGRVLRADRWGGDLAAEHHARPEGPGRMSDRDWEDFQRHLEEGPDSTEGTVALYFEYFVPIS